MGDALPHRQPSATRCRIVSASLVAIIVTSTNVKTFGATTNAKVAIHSSTRWRKRVTDALPHRQPSATRCRIVSAFLVARTVTFTNVEISGATTNAKVAIHSRKSTDLTT